MNDMAADAAAMRKATSARHRSKQQQPSGPLLVVAAEAKQRAWLRATLERHGMLVEVTGSVVQGEALRERSHFDLLIIDAALSDPPGLDWVRELRGRGVDTEVILLAGTPEPQLAIEALRGTVSDVLEQPLQERELLSVVARCLSRSRGSFRLAQGDQRDAFQCGLAGMIGQSRVMREIGDVVCRVAPTTSTVLIEGESGTGKELVAKCIHDYSGRRGPFVPVNCGAIAPDLLESELFGHLKGAFTGAHGTREGLFCHASGGTLFLDEIAELPLSMQAKLLRALEESAVRPVGSDRVVPVDARIVAATNRRLEEEVREGRLREDLFYRLNVLTLTLPPLRDRREDIPDLARHFVEVRGRELGLEQREIAPADLETLCDHPWPGNVRELKNVIERALLLGKSPVECLTSSRPEPSRAAATSEGADVLDLPLREVEKRHMLAVLAHTANNKSEAARRLGVSRKTLERKLRQWQAAE